MELDEEHTKLLQQFKDEVQPLLTEQYLLEWCDDSWYVSSNFNIKYKINYLTIQSCVRYLEARDWNVSNSIKLIKSTIDWRIEKRPEITPCPLCPEDPFSHNLVNIATVKLYNIYLFK